MGWFESKGLRLHYEVSGTGPACLVLGGSNPLLTEPGRFRAAVREFVAG